MPAKRQHDSGRVPPLARRDVGECVGPARRPAYESRFSRGGLAAAADVGLGPSLGRRKKETWKGVSGALATAGERCIGSLLVHVKSVT